jgi:hypothetical protein
VFFKHAGFVDERELRAAWRVTPEWRFVLHWPTRFGVTPYVEVAAPRDVDRAGVIYGERFLSPDEVGRLPIRAVRIGPTRAGDAAEHALRMLLATNGYADAEILRSETPFR